MRCRGQVTFQTELGQLIDLITAPEDHVDLSKFSLEKSVPHSVLRPDVPRQTPPLTIIPSHLPSQTPPHRRLQDRILLILPPRRLGHANGRNHR